jgi:two-component system sensor histidine kinase KdpD
LSVDLDPKLPLVYVAAALLEQAIGQLIENAAKYSPAGTDIAMVARTEDREVSITDKGAGLTEEEVNNLSHRSCRGPRHIANVPRRVRVVDCPNIRRRKRRHAFCRPGPQQGTTMSIRLPIVRIFARKRHVE